MKTVKLNKEEIQDAMWDGCDGFHILAVASDGREASIHWAETNRQWDNWPDDWLTIKIPCLDPDGSGQGNEDAQELLQDIGLINQAKTLMEEVGDIGWIGAIERLAPADWEANREMERDWLADAFLNACNGEGDDLNDPSPWGFAGGPYDPPEDIAPPALFEWA